MAKCVKCKGLGMMTTQKGLDTCTRCGGSGRLFGQENAPKHLTFGEGCGILFHDDKGRNHQPDGYKPGAS